MNKKILKKKKKKKLKKILNGIKEDVKVKISFLKQCLNRTNFHVYGEIRHKTQTTAFYATIGSKVCRSTLHCDFIFDAKLCNILLRVCMIQNKKAATAAAKGSHLHYFILFPFPIWYPQHLIKKQE
jgi:hypothetical protein